jgi:hypothetical protein
MTIRTNRPPVCAVHLHSREKSTSQHVEAEAVKMVLLLNEHEGDDGTHCHSA